MGSGYAGPAFNLLKAFLLMALLILPGCFTKAQHELLFRAKPLRSDSAVSGSAFAGRIRKLPLNDREAAIAKEILSGNVPAFSRSFCPVTVKQELDGRIYTLTFYATNDYLAVGSEQDYFYTPLTPGSAQLLADTLDCLLPTSKMVDFIYEAAKIKLTPQPIAPSDTMTTVPVFWQHTDSIKTQFAVRGLKRSQKTLVAGHKKDIIISNKIYSSDRSFDRVVIYGWHKAVGDPIQPVYNGHGARYADYSHGVRLISNSALLNGDTIRVADVLKDENLAPLLSDEGIIQKPHYPRR